MVLQDLTLVAALLMLAFAATGLISAWIEDTFPTRGLAFLVLAGVLAWETWESRGRVVTFEDVPVAFMRLVKIALEQLS